ncbi:MAG TPA: ATP-binding protein [Polyangia bacterium]|nr:ATP-binding protein [Polyangia bacterium]
MSRKPPASEIERLRLENEQLLESRRLADETRDRYMELYDHLPLAHLTLDGVGIIRDLNEDALTFLRGGGDGRPRLVGTRLKRLVREGDHPALAAHLREGPVRRETFSCEIRLRDSTPVRLWSRRIRPGLRLYPTVIVDLREREQQAIETRRLLDAEKAARVASHAKDQFIASLSHELRTPLTPVLAAVTGMQGRPDVPDHLRVVFEMIRRNILTEARLIDDLLDVTRITQGKMRIERQAMDVHETIRDATEMLDSEVRAKHLLLSLSLDAADHGAAADPVRIKQVFWNLLRNAIRFTPDGGAIEVRSWNASTNGNRLLRVEVSDNGPGFDPALASRLFEPFEQADALERSGGLGLGLAICRGVMELHGGSVIANSRGPGQGARFVVEIEATHELPARAEPPPASRPLIERKPRILLVEDDPDTGELLGELLQNAGYAVNTVRSAKAALDSDLDNVDLVISDIGLPGVSGLDLMRTIRQGRPLRGVALSGYGTEADIHASEEAGFSAHLTKPVAFADLLATIRQVGA